VTTFLRRLFPFQQLSIVGLIFYFPQIKQQALYGLKEKRNQQNNG
jgi:hypothetical protein